MNNRRKEHEKTASKKEEILRVATNLFLRKGYERTSTSSICKEANIVKPTLYHFFINKRHLFFLCHKRAIEKILLPYLNKASNIKDPMERFQFIIREFTKMICNNPELKVLIHENLSIKDKYFREIRDVWRAHYILLKDTIAELQYTGQISNNIPTSRGSLFLIGMITWTTFWFNYEKTEKIDELADHVLEFAFKGLSCKLDEKDASGL